MNEELIFRTNDSVPNPTTDNEASSRIHVCSIETEQSYSTDNTLDSAEQNPINDIAFAYDNNHNHNQYDDRDSAIHIRYRIVLDVGRRLHPIYRSIRSDNHNGNQWNEESAVRYNNVKMECDAWRLIIVQ